MRQAISRATAIVLFMGVAAGLHGQVVPIDNFDAMDPTLPGWTKVDLAAGQPWGPGVYDPSSGALRIYHSGNELVTPGAPFTQTAMFALWNNSTDPFYANGFLRAKIRTNEAYANTALEMRLDLSTATAYLLFDATIPYLGQQGGFALHKFVNGVETSLWESPNDGIEYLRGEDWNLELGAVGNQISAKVWRAGAPEPPLPQFSTIDQDPITGGMIGISSDKGARGARSRPRRRHLRRYRLHWRPRAEQPVADSRGARGVDFSEKELSSPVGQRRESGTAPSHIAPCRLATPQLYRGV